MIIPVITLWRPWSYCIEKGWKTIETRTHDRFKNLEGKRIGIHAGKAYDKDFYTTFYMSSNSFHLTEMALDPTRNDRIGEIVCTAFVDQADWIHSNNYKCSEAAMVDCINTKRFGLWLTDIKPIQSPVLPGGQGIWYYDTDAMRKVSRTGLRKL